MLIVNDQVDLVGFFERLRRHGALLILDYDGTLAPFVKNRRYTPPYPGVIERLSALNETGNIKTIIVSGRSLSDLQGLLKWPEEMELWGSHGLERRLERGKQQTADLPIKVQLGIKQGKYACRAIDPEYCEIKPFGVALHWRGLSSEQRSQIELIRGLWESIAALHDLEIHNFDGGIELRPKCFNKGDVVCELIKSSSSHAAVACLGDDLTDEEAFAAIGNSGLKILVRKKIRPTLADICLAPPQELLAFLDRCLAARRRDG